MKQFWFFVAFSVFDKKGKKLYDDFCFKSITSNENEIEFEKTSFIAACKTELILKGKMKDINEYEILITNVNSLSK